MFAVSHRTVPLDEAAVEVVLDLSGRPYLHYEVEFPGEKILGDPPFDPQLVEEFWRAFVMSSGITLHIVRRRGKNTHHIIEANFKEWLERCSTCGSKATRCPPPRAPSERGGS